MSTPLSVLFGHYLLATERSAEPAYAGSFDTSESADDDLDGARDAMLRYLAATTDRMAAEGYPIDVIVRFFGLEPTPELTNGIEEALARSYQPDRIENLYSIYDHHGTSSIPTAECLKRMLKRAPRPLRQADIDRAFKACSAK